MSWKALMEVLRERGWTQKLIRERLASQGVDVGQATLSELANDKNSNPNWALGDALRKLHDSNEGPPADAVLPGAFAKLAQRLLEQTGIKVASVRFTWNDETGEALAAVKHVPVESRERVTARA